MTQAQPVSRVDTQALEPRYLALLEAERANWWQSENFDRWKDLYVSEYARGRYVLETLGAYVPGFSISGTRVLDIGCGDAGVVIYLAEHGARAAGIEANEKSLARARVRAEEHGVDVDLRGARAEGLPFPDASFDLVILDNVLEHVDDPARTLEEIHRVLAPGGILYLVTPKPFAAYSLWRDPHYDLAGLVLLPRRAQIFYFERMRGGGKGTYDVGIIPTRRAIVKMLERARFRLIADPRDLWIRYLRDRISRPEEVGAGVKRRLAQWLTRRGWPFENRALRLMWDVMLGSNFFIARRQD